MIHFSYNLNDLIFRLLVPICLNLVGVYYFLVGDVVKLRYLECKLELANEMTTRLIRSGLDVCPYRPSNGRSRLLALGIFCQSTEVLKYEDPVLRHHGSQITAKSCCHDLLNPQSTGRKIIKNLFYSIIHLRMCSWGNISARNSKFL